MEEEEYHKKSDILLSFAYLPTKSENRSNKFKSESFGKSSHIQHYYNSFKNGWKVNWTCLQSSLRANTYKRH